MLVTDIMTTDVHCITAETTLATLKEIFRSVTYHHLLVHDSDQCLIGVISDRDVIRQASPYLNTDLQDNRDINNLNTTAQDMMATKLITIEKDTPIDVASILLLENNISCLPVVTTKSKIEGIMTWKDLLKYYVYIQEN